MATGARGARTTVSWLLAGSGLASLAAARERWWPACPAGDFDAPACLRVQDHSHDYLVPAEPWTAVGHAAELHSVALVLLAVAVGVLPWLWLRHPVALVQVPTLVVSVALLLVAVCVFLSAWTERAVALPGLGVAVVVWALGWPAYLVLAALVPHSGGWHAGSGRRLVFLALLLASTPLASLVVAPAVTGYVSHDTTPWTEGVSGAFLLAAAVALWPATRPVTPASAPRTPGRSGPVGRARTSGTPPPAPPSRGRRAAARGSART
jgi:hypothetical protein